MVKIGRVCTLEVVKFTESGAYLDGGPYGEILLPNRYVSVHLKAGQDVDVFISFDSEDRLVATTDFPLAMVGEFAFLKVIDVNKMGAFLDWGLPKDLFVPFREQANPMGKGKRYLVRIYVDPKTGRIAASSKINKFLNQESPDYAVGQEVDLLIAFVTDLGYKAIINQNHMGVLYANEVFKNLKIGEALKGYIKKIRPDGKIDLSLEIQGYKKVDPVAERILDKLKAEGGFLPCNDKSSPEYIQNLFGISKKTFKQAIGSLYKNQMIRIEDTGLFLQN